ncbi:hypothetical protein B0H13DRAFT_1867255 [Mycena leptocephala]|nr:hypothetical protein B0H13DRAFT_1867255 [Mycena leptocephala]
MKSLFFGYNDGLSSPISPTESEVEHSSPEVRILEMRLPLCSTDHPPGFSRLRSQSLSSVDVNSPFYAAPPTGQPADDTQPALVAGPSSRRGWVVQPSPLRRIKRHMAGGPANCLNLTLPPGKSVQETIYRSIEPLASVEDVFVVDFEEEESFWVVPSDEASKLASHLRIAGRSVHFRPSDVYRPHTQISSPYRITTTMRHYVDPIVRPLDPRHPSISLEDFEELRRIIGPHIVGIQIFQYGEVEIVSSTTPEETLTSNKWPLTIGGLDYFVTKSDPSSMSPTSCHLVPYGAKVSSGSRDSGACLGVKVLGPDGELAITAVTHAFVNHSSYKSETFAQKFANAFLAVPWLLRQSISFFYPRSTSPPPPSHERPSASELPVTTTSRWADKMEVPILGIDVFSRRVDDSSLRRVDVGTITRVFDFPSSSLPYPDGYVYDVSLMTGPNLPEIIALPGLPRLTGFVPFDEIFDYRNKAVFTVTYPYIGGPNSEIRGQILAGKMADISTQEALLTGASYRWIPFWRDNAQIARLSSSVLWRSKVTFRLKRNENSAHDFGYQSQVSQDGDYLKVAGFSGSVLCVGSDAASSTTLVPSAAQVLGFQNFETTFPQVLHRDTFPRGRAADPTLLTYKGAFRLPDYLYQSSIIMPGMETSVSDPEALKAEENLSLERRDSI